MFQREIKIQKILQHNVNRMLHAIVTVYKLLDKKSFDLIYSVCTVFTVATYHHTCVVLLFCHQGRLKMPFLSYFEYQLSVGYGSLFVC